MLYINHAPRTGGTALVSALNLALPGKIAGHVGDWRKHVSWRDGVPTQFKAVVGNLTIDGMPADAVKLTVVRDPVEHVRSNFSYFRDDINHIPRSHQFPPIRWAKDAPTFSDYLRKQTTWMFNQQSRVIGDAAAYSYVGTTDNLSIFLNRALSLLDYAGDISAQALLGMANRNSSSKPFNVSKEDRDYIISHSSLDAELYQTALSRSSELIVV